MGARDGRQREELEVGGDDARTALIPLADHLKQAIGAEPVDRQIAQFGDDEQ